MPISHPSRRKFSTYCSKSGLWSGKWPHLPKKWLAMVYQPTVYKACWCGLRPIPILSVFTQEDQALRSLRMSLPVIKSQKERFNFRSANRCRLGWLNRLWNSGLSRIWSARGEGGSLESKALGRRSWISTGATLEASVWFKKAPLNAVVEKTFSRLWNQWSFFIFKKNASIRSKKLPENQELWDCYC